MSRPGEPRRPHGPPRAPSPELWPAKPDSEAEALAAGELVERLLLADRPEGAARSRETSILISEMERLDPVALAPRYSFALVFPRVLMAVIMPTSLWERERAFCPGFGPSERLLPENSVDVNFAGVWMLPKLQSIEQAPELVCELLRRGFVWEPSLQALCDADGDRFAVSHTPVGPHLRTLLDARELDLALIDAAPGRPSPRV